MYRKWPAFCLSGARMYFSFIRTTYTGIGPTWYKLRLHSVHVSRFLLDWSRPARPKKSRKPFSGSPFQIDFIDFFYSWKEKRRQEGKGQNELQLLSISVRYTIRELRSNFLLLSSLLPPSFYSQAFLWKGFGKASLPRSSRVRVLAFAQKSPPSESQKSLHIQTICAW